MATATQNQNTAISTGVLSSIQTGAIAALVGGGIFGVQMLVAGMMPMIASMVGSESVVIGFILHMLISAIIGATFGFIAPRLSQNLAVLTVGGFIWGLVWWVLGALVIMPLVLGMGEMVLVVGDMQLGSLIGHSIFGITMGVFYFILSALQAR